MEVLEAAKTSGSGGALSLEGKRINPVFCSMSPCSTCVLGQELIPMPPKASRDTSLVAWSPMRAQLEQKHSIHPNQRMGRMEGDDEKSPNKREFKCLSPVSSSSTTGLLVSLRQCHLRQRWPRCASSVEGEKENHKNVLSKCPTQRLAGISPSPGSSWGMFEPTCKRRVKTQCQNHQKRCQDLIQT